MVWSLRATGRRSSLSVWMLRVVRCWVVVGAGCVCWLQGTQGIWTCDRQQKWHLWKINDWHCSFLINTSVSYICPLHLVDQRGAALEIMRLRPLSEFFPSGIHLLGCCARPPVSLLCSPGAKTVEKGGEEANHFGVLLSLPLMVWGAGLPLEARIRTPQFHTVWKCAYAQFHTVWKCAYAHMQLTRWLLWCFLVGVLMLVKGHGCRISHCSCAARC